MATALTAQLAKIRTQSTNSHDLKAQKKVHSQSLLFKPRAAATQDFGLVYQLCFEGFEELCRLDSRFTHFANNVFSEQSKEEDRTQMTVAQNQQLDAVLEEFLSLVGSKLLLKPALKAVEWLVRRFRIHENNTLCFLLTFLPYHTTAMFTTVLSILPSTLPSTLKFLHPYIQSLANPPRHTIVYTASQSRSFFAALNIYVLRTSRLGFQYPTLISFWASVATEAVAAMLDHARSSKRESQKQNQEDIAIFLLPVINEGLSFEGVSDLRIGCYMVLTVLASKANLSDGVITAMMEAVTNSWTKTSHAGLICLSVLAQQRENPALPRKVFKAIIALGNVDDDLKTLKKQYKVDKLVLGVVLGILSGLDKARNAKRLSLVRSLMEAGLMDEVSIVSAIRSVFETIQSSRSGTKVPLDVQGSLNDLVLRLAESKSVGPSLRTTMQGSGIETDRLEMRLQHIIESDAYTPDQMIEDVVMEDTSGQGVTDDFNNLISRIPTRTAYEISFLSHSQSYVYHSLAQVFTLLSATEANVESFSELPVLRKSLAMSEPLFFSFHIRFWCGDGPSNARAAAIRTISNYTVKEPLNADVQILLPYLIYALADPCAIVRRAATELVLGLARVYREALNASKKPALLILGHDSIYGQGKETKESLWLSMEDSRSFMASVLVPGAQECRLDQDHVYQLVSDSLSGSKRSNKSHTITKDLRKPLRHSVFSYLCSHVVNTPLYRVKSRLLPMLNQVTKVGSTSRTKSLVPILSECTGKSEEDFQRICQHEEIDKLQLLDEIFCIVLPDDRDGIQCLRRIIDSGIGLSFPSLKSAALRRLQSLWPSMKSDVQTSIANALLEQALRELTSDAATDQEIEITETLRSLPMSTMILQSFVESLPTMASALQDKPPASKRRRTSQGESTSTAPNSKESFLTIKKTTLILELIEDRKAERHPELLKGLFQILSQLQQPQSHQKSTIDYLLVLTVDSILAIVRKAGASTGSNIDHSAIRTDILIDCVRTTTNPQVRNSALLLVAALATVTPDLVLHSVMPIFTFMGANVLRQEDDFSAHVVKQTMESVIPRLVQSLHKQKDGPLFGVFELLLSFAAAFKHVPSPRRLQLFSSLVDKVGPQEYLFALLAILIRKYPEDRKVLQFAADIASIYDVNVRLQTVAKFLELVLDAQKPKPSLSASLLILSNDRSLESTTANLLQLPFVVLNNQVLISKIQKIFAKEDDDTVSLQTSYAQILEETFLLSQQFKGNEKLDILCMRTLDSSLGLLPLSDLVDTLQSLLLRTENNTRRQVLRSFELRLSKSKTDQHTTRRACLAFLPRLLSVIEESSDLSLKLIGIGAVDKITERFGKKAIPTVVESARTILSDVCLGASEISIRVVSLLCLATMVEVSGENFVPVIPKAFSKAVDNLAFSIQEETNDAGLHNAIYTFISALLLYVPWVVTGEDLNRVLNISYESANAEMGEECDLRRVGAIQLIPKQLEAKDCFTALYKTWPNAMIEGPLAVKEYVDILHLGIDRHAKSVVMKHSDTLGDLFERMFDLRRIQFSPPTEDSYTDDEIEEVEEAVNDAAIAMIYKLNDATFRPLFSKMLEWSSFSESSDNNARVHRQTTWYKFLFKFFDTLKSIVTSYAGFILDDSVEILNKGYPENEPSLLLWRQIVLTLHKTFEHDQDDFYQSPNHFAPISTVLLSQLSKAAEIPLLPELIPTIAEMAVATDSATHHKEMNTAILQHMRSNISAVRLAAVQCERALTERLGEEWLALLPEMLPFISEALEDDDESVESEVQRWVKGIEGILGESLNPMLQ